MGNDTQTLTLTDFLLARIADVEEFVQKCDETGEDADPSDYPGLRAALDPVPFAAVPARGAISGHESAEAPGRYWLAADPAFVLAECEAKRRIVALHRPIADVPEWASDISLPEGTRPLEACPTCDTNYATGGCPTLRLLALPYADHPDFRAEWRA